MSMFEYTDESGAVFSIPFSNDLSNFDPNQHPRLDPNDTVANFTFSNGSPSDTDDDFIEKLWLELLSFNRFWEFLLNILEPCQITSLAFGFLGNLLALITLLHSKRMYTPSFLYHRALVGADLLFCTNFFINLLIDRFASVGCKQQIYRYWFAAFYSATVNPCINSICSYALSYSTVAATLDRFFALSWFTSYQIWNQRVVAIAVISSTTFLSITLHSWTTFVQNVVIEYRLDRDLNDTSLIWEPCWTDQIVYHCVKRDQIGTAYETAYNVKEIYNAVFRIAYSLVLALLALGIISGLLRRGKRKRRLTRRASKCGQAIWGRIPSQRTRRNDRCEQALLLLTISVLILALLQVAASEGRRILQFAFPAADIIRSKVDNAGLPIQERLENFRWVLYAHQATRALANFFTVIERSAICFLYVATNKLFRGELLLFLSALFLWGRSGIQFRQRFESDARNLKRNMIHDQTKDLGLSTNLVGNGECGEEMGILVSVR